MQQACREELAVLFREIDVNGDLTVDFKEFTRWAGKTEREDQSRARKRESHSTWRAWRARGGGRSSTLTPWEILGKKDRSGQQPVGTSRETG